MSYEHIRKIVEETDITRVQEYLGTKEWEVLAIATGHEENGKPCCLYSLGWHGPYVPYNPEGVDGI